MRRLGKVSAADAVYRSMAGIALATVSTHGSPRMSDTRITQEMIDLYNEFAHQTFDRRAFMGRLAALAGGLPRPTRSCR